MGPLYKYRLLPILSAMLLWPKMCELGFVVGFVGPLILHACAVLLQL